MLWKGSYLFAEVSKSLPNLKTLLSTVSTIWCTTCSYICKKTKCRRLSEHFKVAQAEEELLITGSMASAYCFLGLRSCASNDFFCVSCRKQLRRAQNLSSRKSLLPSEAFLAQWPSAEVFVCSN